jgi:hypothetical protein
MGLRPLCGKPIGQTNKSGAFSGGCPVFGHPASQR